MAITYKPSPLVLGQIVVYLDGKKTGLIKQVLGGYQYVMNKNHKGDVFKTVAEVKQSLEEA